MTNKHDGPRAGTPVQVLQSAKPTRLTQAEADELDRLITAVIKAKYVLGYTEALELPEAAGRAVESDEALRALYRWQLTHGLEAK